jgi:hypothetical protein
MNTANADGRSRLANKGKGNSGIKPVLLPVADFAATMGLSVWTARRDAYIGKIDSVKLGGKLLIPASEVDRLIRENMRPRLDDSIPA